MSYNEFMFEEAFDFHQDQPVKMKKENSTSSVDTQRLPPLGACSNEVSSNPSDSIDGLDMNSYLELQQSNEQLNASLFALTSHFAQVQFRLKQIIDGSKQEQEKLLRELEEFAFTGCPDVVGPNEKKVSTCVSCMAHDAIGHYERRIAEEKEREKRLEAHLKKMISNLESCQKEEPKKHRGSFIKRKKHEYSQVLKEEPNSSTYFLSEQTNQLDISDQEDEWDQADTRERVPQEKIKEHIDKTMAKLINPRKAKENIIEQVSKQINDMEKFVTFLKGYDSTTELETDHEKSVDADSRVTKHVKHKNTAPSVKLNSNTVNKNSSSSQIPAPHTKFLELSDEKRKRLHDASVAVIKKSIAVLQIFAISQFGCSAKHFQEHMMRKAYKTTVSNSEYIKPFEKLRSSIDQIMVLHTKLIDIGGLHPDSEDELNLPLSTADKCASWTRRRSTRRSVSRTDSVSSTSSSATLPPKSIEAVIQEDLIRLVRGDFATALKELLQHGLVESFQSGGLSTKALVGCMSSHSTTGYGLHIWEYFNKFYKLKHGAKFNTQPNMTLSEAFGMDIGCTQQTPKQSLLTVLHRIKETHESRKRGFDAMYKALISAGLNRGRLAQWIRLVIRCPELVDRHYERWSYVVRSGFDEVLTLLEKLSSLTFFLPEDLAVRHLLKNINEFGDA